MKKIKRKSNDRLGLVNDSAYSTLKTPQVLDNIPVVFLNLKMICLVCQDPFSSHCARCGIASYCSRDHQKAHWNTHKLLCFETQGLKPCNEELLLRITTCLAQNGYHHEVGIMVQVSKVFWFDIVREARDNLWQNSKLDYSIISASIRELDDLARA